MRARLGLLPALAVLLCAALLAPASVLAATSEQVAAAAQTSWKQTCVVNTGNITCTGPTSRVHIWLGVLLPASGPVTRRPTSGYVSELSPGAFMAALGVFAAFGALSIVTWAYFRFRSKPKPAAEAA